MQIQKIDNSTNFKGAFRINPAMKTAKSELPELFIQGRQIFRDILEKGDQVIVLRNSYDKRVGEYIKNNGAEGIEYYPAINTSSGLDDQMPDKLRELITDKSNEIVTGLNEILERITTQKKSCKFKKHRVGNELEKISNALRLNIENPKITMSKASSIIRDEEKKRTIEVIVTTSKSTFVYVKPDSLNEDSIKCVLDGSGNLQKIYNTPKDAMRFLKKFSELKKQQVNILCE